ncbi:hypothetical protein BC629DRAFT_977035 [Irpex lacteus]|nr:hypothetical protein BC629DRAFT_977035 [Irpex lacteus]
MDDIAHDTEIGPELIAFLTQKVKTTKEALNVSMKENEDLRKEIARLRDESRSESSSEESVKDEFANTTCQSGQCKSRDEASAFRIELIEALERLKARELAVRDALEQAHEFKLKYGDAMRRVKQQQKTIDELKERLRQMQHTTDQNSQTPRVLNYQFPITKMIPLHTARSIFRCHITSSHWMITP